MASKLVVDINGLKDLFFRNLELAPPQKIGLHYYFLLLLSDIGIQLLPFDSDSTLNPINAANNIPYDEITDYLKLPTQYNPNSKFMAIFA